MAGYHFAEIRRGKLGELSKVREELEEAMDGEAQGNPVMVLQELSDLIGAVDGYLKERHPSITVYDLITMAQATERAFLSGDRT